MHSTLFGPSLRRPRTGAFALAAGVTLLAGCGLVPSDPFALDPRAQFTSVPPSRAWIATPESGLVMQGRINGRLEQQVLLPNHTTLGGDNVIVMRAMPVHPGSAPVTLDMERMLEAIGGLPAPFDTESLSILRSRTDDAGTLTWTVFTTGAGTSCVLAFRRLDESRRVVMLGADAIQLVMRNCVRGEEEDALLPLRPEVVGFPAVGGRHDAAAPRTLSPLAAPLP